jgi:hypothetical protein
VILARPREPTYHIVRGNTCKSAKLRCAEYFMPRSQGARRTSALVMAAAFPHHAAQEKPHPKRAAPSREWWTKF